MKKYIKHLLAILLFFSYTINTSAQEPCPPDIPDCETSGGGDETGGGNGVRSTPIDDYAPLLIITAITIAGLISYRQTELLKK